MCPQKLPLFDGDITSAVFKNCKTRFKKQDRLIEQSIVIFGTFEGFYMYWHLGFLIFIFIQEYFDAHVVWHIFLGKKRWFLVTGGRGMLGSHSGQPLPQYFAENSIFLIPHSTSRGIFKHVFASHDFFLVSLKSVLFYWKFRPLFIKRAYDVIILKK